jgi:hypothetical protein
MIRPTKQKESIGSRASKISRDASASLAVVAETASALTTGRAATEGAVIDIKQTLGVGARRDSGVDFHEIERQTDIFGGMTIPEMDFKGMMPGDYQNPTIAVSATEEQLTTSLETYAGGTRAQKIYQAAFKYVAEIGKTKQEYHKAQASIIKGTTEGVKVQQEIVRLDRQKVELETDIVKLEQSGEKLTQEGIKLTGFQKETTQITRKIEAMEAKRDAEIKGIEIQTQMIIQRYLVESME